MTSLPPSLHTVHHTVSFPSIPTSIPPPPHFSIPPRLNLLHATSSSSIPSSPASHPFTPIPVISPMGELCPIQQNSLTAVEGHSTPQLVVPTQSVGALPPPMVPPLEAERDVIPSIAQVSSISPPFAPSLTTSIPHHYFLGFYTNTG